VKPTKSSATSCGYRLIDGPTMALIFACQPFFRRADIVYQEKSAKRMPNTTVEVLGDYRPQRPCRPHRH
jgi:hypothetical protein